LKSEIPEILVTFNEILEKGFDGHHFITGLSSHFRDLLVCKDPATIQLLEVGKEVQEKYRIQALASDHDFLLKALEIANQCDLNYKTTHNKRLLVELTLIKIAQIVQKKK